MFCLYLDYGNYGFSIFDGKILKRYGPENGLSDV